MAWAFAQKELVRFGFAVIAVLGCSVASARADLHVMQATVSAGEVRAGTILTHPFTFTNQGNETIEVLGTRSSCGCLTVLLEERVYKPGESGRLLLQVNTLGERPGDNSWSVRVVYRKGNQIQEATLQMSAQVVKEVVVQPASLTVHTDSVVGHPIVVTDLRAKPLTVTQVQTSSARLKARAGEQTRDDAGHVIRTIYLEIAVDCPEGKHDDVVNIYTNDASYPLLCVPVTIVKRARQRISATPREVTMTIPASQPIPSRIVLLRDKDNQPVVIDRIEADDPAVQCTWAQGPSNAATVKVRFEVPRANADGLRSALRVHVKQPVAEVLTIPVVVSLQQ